MDLSKIGCPSSDKIRCDEHKDPNCPMVTVGPEVTQEEIQRLIGLGYLIVFEVE